MEQKPKVSTSDIISILAGLKNTSPNSGTPKSFTEVDDKKILPPHPGNYHTPNFLRNFKGQNSGTLSNTNNNNNNREGSPLSKIFNDKKSSGKFSKFDSLVQRFKFNESFDSLALAIEAPNKNKEVVLGKMTKINSQKSAAIAKTIKSLNDPFFF